MEDKVLNELHKSSLPLEHGVAAIAVDLGYSVCGEFPYIRLNESNARVEFSVDIHLEFSANDAENRVTKKLHVLVECKYASPGVSWVFSLLPGENERSLTGSSLFTNWWADDFVLTRGLVHPNRDASPYCTRGVSLSTNSADPSGIRHGVNQLRFAAPMLVADTFVRKQINSSEMEASAFSMLLTTNAPLLVLNAGATPNVQESWQSLQAATMPCDHLSVYQQPGPALYEQCEAAASIIKRVAPQSVVARIRDLAAALVESSEIVDVVRVSHIRDHLESLKQEFISMPLELRSKLLAPFARQ